jgi:predicted ATPase
MSEQDEQRARAGRPIRRPSLADVVDLTTPEGRNLALALAAVLRGLPDAKRAPRELTRRASIGRSASSRR